MPYFLASFLDLIKSTYAVVKVKDLITGLYFHLF
jgi:hypothetical protein